MFDALWLLYAGRHLLQQPTCPEGCKLNSDAPGSCVYDGRSGWFLCRACTESSGRVPAVDGSCGCKAGQYLAGGICLACPEGLFCPGGTALQSAASPCGPGLTTINAGSTSSQDCVTLPGNMLSQDGGAGVTCPMDTFSTGYSRATACTPCPAGMSTNKAGGKKSIRDCLVPPGWRAGSLFRVIRCPRGQYREGFVAHAGDVKCARCPDGTTTRSSASQAKADCNRKQSYWLF
ncbi:hypothetical protein COO60DRAFT_492971 [Scenedesmus sp. NREL 46B-D3]|nr:hypothetical protein COO60DRAFT_492971 [Scenedesmus sp. NREL 46B-D3]